MLALILMLLAGDVTPVDRQDVFSREVGLDQRQRDKVAEVSTRLVAKLKQLDDKVEVAKMRIKDKTALTQQMALLKAQRDKAMQEHNDEIDKVLTDQQKQKLAVVQKLRREGLPIGGQLFRSYAVQDYFASSGPPGFKSLNDAFKDAVTRSRDGIKFGITNRGNVDYKEVALDVALLHDGKRVHFDTVVVPNVPKDQTVEVIIRYSGTFTDVDVKLARDPQAR